MEIDGISLPYEEAQKKIQTVFEKLEQINRQYLAWENQANKHVVWLFGIQYHNAGIAIVKKYLGVPNDAVVLQIGDSTPEQYEQMLKQMVNAKYVILKGQPTELSPYTKALVQALNHLTNRLDVVLVSTSAYNFYQLSQILSEGELWSRTFLHEILTRAIGVLELPDDQNERKKKIGEFYREASVLPIDLSWIDPMRPRVVIGVGIRTFTTSPKIRFEPPYTKDSVQLIGRHQLDQLTPSQRLDLQNFQLMNDREILTLPELWACTSTISTDIIKQICEKEKEILSKLVKAPAMLAPGLPVSMVHALTTVANKRVYLYWVIPIWKELIQYLNKQRTRVAGPVALYHFTTAQFIPILEYYDQIDTELLKITEELIDPEKTYNLIPSTPTTSEEKTNIIAKLKQLLSS